METVRKIRINKFTFLVKDNEDFTTSLQEIVKDHVDDRLFPYEEEEVEVPGNFMRDLNWIEI